MDLKTTVIELLRAVTEKADRSPRADEHRAQRDGNAQETSRGNIRNQSTVIEMRNALDGLINRLNAATKESVGLKICQ